MNRPRQSRFLREKKDERVYEMQEEEPTPGTRKTEKPKVVIQHDWTWWSAKRETRKRKNADCHVNFYLLIL